MSHRTLIRTLPVLEMERDEVNSPDETANGAEQAGDEDAVGWVSLP